MWLGWGFDGRELDFFLFFSVARPTLKGVRL